MSLLNSVRPGDRVTITDRFGKRRTGKAVMKGTYGWVLNMGGAHGTPGIADDDNVVDVRSSTGKAKYTGSNPSRDRIIYERGWNVVVKQDDRYLVLRHTSTHAVTDSAYPNLSLAKARVDYLFKTHGDKPFNDLKKNPGNRSGKWITISVADATQRAKQSGVKLPKPGESVYLKWPFKYTLHRDSYGYYLDSPELRSNPDNVSSARERLSRIESEIAQHKKSKSAARMPHLKQQVASVIARKEEECRYLKRFIKERSNPGWKKCTISRSGSAYVVIDQHQRRRSFKTHAGALKHAKKISGNPSIPAGSYMGHAIFFLHISYNCPSLKLYGYSTERAIKNAIKRKLKTKSNPRRAYKRRAKNAPRLGRYKKMKRGARGKAYRARVAGLRRYHAARRKSRRRK